MKKTKHRELKIRLQTEPKFIRFTPLQHTYLDEVRKRQVKEWNDALESVYMDLGIVEKILEAPPGTYRLRKDDLSGLDFVPPPLTDEEKTPH